MAARRDRGRRESRRAHRGGKGRVTRARVLSFSGGSGDLPGVPRRILAARGEREFRTRDALRAEPKLYLFDTLRIPDELESKRLENQVALHLLKACYYWTDTAQGEWELRFVRTKEKREVDFLVLRDRKPWMLVECKSGEKAPAKDLVFFSRLLAPPHRFQLVSADSFDRLYAEHGIRVLGYEKFLAGLL